MPRTAREVSSSGYYHVVLRGIGRQLLFEGPSEMSQFLSILGRYRDQLGFRIIAWCLMGNHVHLLIESPCSLPSEAMKRVALSFAQQHNRNTGHVGHVFQDRYYSKPVVTDDQLLACVRYIHDNPEKAGVCRAGEYPWSSYREYAEGAGASNATLADTSLILDMLGGRDGFLGFSCGEPGTWTEPRGTRRLGDLEARERMKALLSEDELEALESGTKARRDAALVKLKEGGLSVRQIERFTGIGRNVIQRAKTMDRLNEPAPSIRPRKRVARENESSEPSL